MKHLRTFKGLSAQLNTKFRKYAFVTNVFQDKWRVITDVIGLAQ